LNVSSVPERFFVAPVHLVAPHASIEADTRLSVKGDPLRGRTNLAAGTQTAKSVMRRRHPELGPDAIAALSYSWR